MVNDDVQGDGDTKQESRCTQANPGYEIKGSIEFVEINHVYRSFQGKGNGEFSICITNIDGSYKVFSQGTGSARYQDYEFDYTAPNPASNATPDSRIGCSVNEYTPSKYNVEWNGSC